MPTHRCQIDVHNDQMLKLSGKFEQCACLSLYLYNNRVHSIFKTKIKWYSHMQMICDFRLGGECTQDFEWFIDKYKNIKFFTIHHGMMRHRTENVNNRRAATPITRTQCTKKNQNQNTLDPLNLNESVERNGFCWLWRLKHHFVTDGSWVPKNYAFMGKQWNVNNT